MKHIDDLKKAVSAVIWPEADACAKAKYIKPVLEHATHFVSAHPGFFKPYQNGCELVAEVSAVVVYPTGFTALSALSALLAGMHWFSSLGRYMAAMYPDPTRNAIEQEREYESALCTFNAGSFDMCIALLSAGLIVPSAVFNLSSVATRLGATGHSRLCGIQSDLELPRYHLS